MKYFLRPVYLTPRVDCMMVTMPDTKRTVPRSSAVATWSPAIHREGATKKGMDSVLPNMVR